MTTDSSDILDKGLEERERFLSNILSMIPDLVSYIDSDFTYRFANPAYINWFRFTPEQIYGKSMAEVLGDAAFNRAKPYMEQALLGIPQEFQTTLSYSIQGETVEKTVWAHYFPDIQRDGHVSGFFAVVRDVTPLMTAEQIAVDRGHKLQTALKQAIASEQSFRAIFDNAPMGMIQLNSEHKFVVANAAFENFIGYSESELKNMNILELTHPDDMAKSMEYLISLPKQNYPLYRFQKKYITKSGKTVWGMVTSRSVKLSDEKDSETCFFSVIEDVTEIQAKDALLKDAQAKMISSSKMASLGEMAGGVAHEINNPLTIIHGQSEFLELQIANGRVDTKQIRQGLSAIKSTAERIAKIVRGLKNFSRNCDYDPMELSSVSKILESTLDLCKERFANRNVNLLIPQFDDFQIECRPTQISQILTNLLNNSYDAIDHLKEKWIKIEIQRSAKILSIKIADSGNGIPTDLAEKIMEPFFTTKDVGMGTGLGLSISKGIAESHHGQLSYDASSAHTCFILELPIYQRDPERSPAVSLG